ncbi:11029_t:CDS:2 [Entrophospora sp. SA101]|nr:11029_t:CDS:2 [Entrophospora sp. SA101]
MLKFKNLSDLTKTLSSEQDFVNCFEKLRWNGKIISPFDPNSKVYKCANNRYRCKNTGKYFNVPNSQGRSWKDKTPVLGMLERNGNLIAQVVQNTQQNTIEPVIKSNIKQDLNKQFNHQIVNHSAKQYVNEKAHTNSIENFWSHLKRGIYGTYHWISKKHLHSYIDEFVLRFNTRKPTPNLSTTNQINYKNKIMDKKIPCGACGHYLDEVYMHKNENGKIYCTTCELLINSNEDLDSIEPGNIEPASQEELEKNIKTLLNTPPLK